MPAPPPRNAAGVVVPHDHEEIGDGDTVIRRISELWIVLDKNGVRRISTVAYRGSTSNGGMSVDVERFVTDDGEDPVTWVTTPKWIGSVHFNVGFLRQNQFQVGFHPLHETDHLPANPYHGEVWGAFKRAGQRLLQSSAQRYVQNEGVELA